MKFFWDYPCKQAKQPVGFQKTSKHPPEGGGRRLSGTPNLRLERILVISMVARFPITFDIKFPSFSYNQNVLTLDIRLNHKLYSTGIRRNLWMTIAWKNINIATEPSIEEKCLVWVLSKDILF